MKFTRGEALTHAKINKWFSESCYKDNYQLIHFYEYNKYEYDVLMIDKEYGTQYKLYIHTTTQFATIQMLSNMCVHAKHDISTLFF